MSGQDDLARAQALEEFKQLSKLDDDRAIEYLQAADWDFGTAAQAFYLDNDNEDAPASAANTAAQPTVPDNYTGPRTLSGQPAPQSGPSSSSSRKPQQPKRRGIATLGSLASSSHHHDDDDDDDDDEDDDGRNPRDLFAGGEKSGLAVQDPNQDSGNSKKIIGDILAKAKANASRPDSDDAAGPGPSRPTTFRGTGMTLGGDGVESRAIPDPNAVEGAAGGSSTDEPQERVLHLWHDGFSIDGGELRRFDDPANSQDLNMIRAGRAPLHLMNVRYDQPVDVKLNQHDEDYRLLPEYFNAFSGGGRRLGSEVPGDGNTTAAPTAAATSAPATSAGTSASATNVDESQPTITLRIQLPDGTRLPARFNVSQTIDDVYEFVQRASSNTQQRPWVLATTFPNKDHTDRSLVLGEMPEFKKGGTAVVKWA